MTRLDNRKDFAVESEGDINITPARRAWADNTHDGETREWLAEDETYFLRQSLSTPCLNVLEHCEGTNITDSCGRQYLDFHGNCVHQVGFSHPRVVAAIKDQLDKLSFCTRRYTNKPSVQLAKKLSEIAPGDLNKVLLGPGGTVVNGMAMKLARAVTGRYKMISLWDSFHGASLDMISVSGESLFRENAGPLLPGVEHAPPPNCYRCLWDCKDNCTLKCADYIEYILEKERDVAAVIAETIRSTSIIPPAGYWKKVRAACDKYGALLILDEIPNSLGRTGKMFTCENYDVVPDIVTLGKGLGGGIFPLAAMIVREKYDILPDRALGHYTHEKNPVACRAALETISIIEEENMVERAVEMGAYFMDKLRELERINEIIGAVRGLGLMIGMELVKDRQTREPAHQETEQIMYAALSRGLNFKITMGNIITLTPPLIVTPAEIDEAVEILVDCLKEL